MAVNNIESAEMVRAMHVEEVQELIADIFNMERHPQMNERSEWLINTLCNLSLHVAQTTLRCFDVEVLLRHCLMSDRLLRGILDYPLPFVYYELDLANCTVTIPSGHFTWRANHLPNPENRTFTCLHLLYAIHPGRVQKLSANVRNFENITNFNLVQHVKKFMLYPINDQFVQPFPNTEKLNALLNHMPVLETLEIISGEANGCDKFNTVDHVKVDQAQWFNLDVLERMQNKTISLTNHYMSMETFTDYLRLWKTGKFPKLEMFRLGINDEEWSIGDIVGNLGGKPWDYRKRQQFYFPPNVKPTELTEGHGRPYLQEERRFGLDLSDAWDIERRTPDGRTFLASIVNKGYQVIMIVWKDPFQSRRYVPELRRELAEMRAKVESGKYPDGDLPVIENRIYDHNKVLEMLNAL